LAEIHSEAMLQGVKRGCPSMEDEDVKVTGTGYLEAMSKKATVTGRYRDLILSEIRRTAVEVFGHVDLKEQVPIHPFVPSQNAGHDAPRWKGGIAGKLAADHPQYVGVRTDLCEAWAGSEHVKLSAVPYHYEAVVADGWARWEEEREEAKCTVYMIREPLKLRTITAGDPSLYGSLQPLLDQMRRGLQRHDVFRLTREENNCAWLGERLNQGSAFMRHTFRKVNSGDYQQSTNDLSMECTDTVRRVVYMEDTLGAVVHRALGPQTLLWDTLCVLQENGQLMGSPLSFPVLCVVNAALKRLAYCLAYDRWWDKSLDYFPMAINGDDIVARCDDVVYNVWLELLEAVNWKLSPGKAYFLSDVAQVNSQTMKVSWVSLDRIMLHNPIPFPNSGFLQQMTKATAQIDESPLDQMSFDWQRRWESLNRLPDGCRKRAREVMLRNLDSLCYRLKKEGWTPFQLKPTNPTGLGGLGIPADVPMDLEVAFEELKCRRTKPSTFLEKLARANDTVPPPPLPYLTQAKSGAGLRDLLLFEERRLAAQVQLELTAPRGHVDPLMERSTLAGADAQAGILILRLKLSSGVSGL